MRKLAYYYACYYLASRYHSGQASKGYRMLCQSMQLIREDFEYVKRASKLIDSLSGVSHLDGITCCEDLFVKGYGPKCESRIVALMISKGEKNNGKVVDPRTGMRNQVAFWLKCLRKYRHSL